MIKREVQKKDNKVKLTFVQPYEPTQSAISLVGDFNNWDPKANKLVKRANGTASVSLTVDAGQKRLFRYVREDGTWFNDEAADAYELGEHGTENCVVVG